MAEDKNGKVPFREAAPIPKMQPVQSGGTEKKGAPIPNMQPVPTSQSQSGGGQINGGQAGQSDAGKKK